MTLRILQRLEISSRRRRWKMVNFIHQDQRRIFDPSDDFGVTARGGAEIQRFSWWTNIFQYEFGVWDLFFPKDTLLIYHHLPYGRWMGRSCRFSEAPAAATCPIYTKNFRMKLRVALTCLFGMIWIIAERYSIKYCKPNSKTSPIGIYDWVYHIIHCIYIYIAKCTWQSPLVHWAAAMRGFIGTVSE